MTDDEYSGRDIYLLNKTGEVLNKGDSVWVTYKGLLTADNAYISRRNGASYISSNLSAIDVVGAIDYASIYLRNSTSDTVTPTALCGGNVSCSWSIFGHTPFFKGITDGFIDHSVIQGSSLTFEKFSEFSETRCSVIGSLLMGDENKFRHSHFSIGTGRCNSYPFLAAGSIAGGAHNTVNHANKSLILGMDNVCGTIEATIIAGTDNKTIGNIGQSIISGNQNNVSGSLSRCFLIGDQNQIGGSLSNSVILGEYANIPSNYYQLGGAYSEISGGALIIGGGSNGGINGYSNALIATQMGNIYVSGNYNTNGADYAERFEWVDGNTNKEDRRGLFVVLVGNKIRLANKYDDREDILGVVSAFPSVVGDAYETEWHGKFETDIFGAPILIECEETIGENGENKTIKVLKKKISDDYDSTKTYIPRSQRAEYDYVGTMGKLVLVDDGTCEANNYCYPSVNGIATKCIDKSKGYKVMERLDSSHIRVWIK